MSVNTAVTPASDRVDSRAVRFTASVTAGVLAVVLILAKFDVDAAALLLAVQALVFAAGALGGPEGHPYGLIFRRLIAPRLGPATKTEAVEQIRFAQMMGFIFCTVGVAGFVSGSHLAGLIATGVALSAALVRVIFGICLSRGPYMLVCRLRGKVPACCRNK